MYLRLNTLAASLAAALAVPLLAVATPASGADDNMMAERVTLASPQQSARLLSTLSAAHGLSREHGMLLSREHSGVTGTKVSRINHTFKDVRIWHSESVVVTDHAGNILSESISERRHLLGRPGPGLRADAADMSVTPTLTSADAIGVVVKALAPNGTHSAPPSAELIIYPIMKTVRIESAMHKAEAELNALDVQHVVSGYELAYLVKTRMVNYGRPVLHDSIISAHDGRLLQRIDAMHTVVGVGHSQYNGDVPIQTTQSNGAFIMKDSTRGVGGTYGGMAITNANHNTSAGAIYTNTTNTWGDGKNYVSGGSTVNANGQTAAVNALWGLMNMYDMLKNTLGWQSLDGKNTATYIAVHVNSNYDNAYYDDGCRCMFIGDGNQFYSLGSIDVIGHEMSHGITARTSNLTYSGESGGLNESNSDIGGEMVEAYARKGGTGSTIPAGNDWFSGKEIAKSGVPLRFLQKPSKDGHSPDAWSSGIGSLNVHYSSGPNNRMFYFLSQGSNATIGNDAYSQYLVKTPKAMTGIGNDHAYRIWFKANTTKFTTSTNYADARAKVMQSALELYGATSKEYIAVQRAYAAINVGADVDEPCLSACGPLVMATQPANVTVPVGDNASFAVAASGGVSPYTYSWYKNGVLVTSATTATYSFAVTAADKGATVYAKIKDHAATPVTVTSSTASVTINTAGVDRLVNGGFESGATGWNGSTNVINAWAAQGQRAVEGSKVAWLGGNGVAVTEAIYQELTLPAAATSATLAFSLHIDTAEVGAAISDKLTVTVQSTTGAVLGTLATYSNVNAAPGYQTRTFDLSAYKGKTVRISFSETENSSRQTSFVLDKVSLITK